MRIIGAAAVVALSLGVAGSAALAAQSTFAGFWKKFKPAAAGGDTAAMARLTRLPFQFKATITDQNGLKQALVQLFDAPTRACFAKAKPFKDGNYYSVTCGPRTFGFDANEGTFQFSGINPSD